MQTADTSPPAVSLSGRTQGVMLNTSGMRTTAGEIARHICRQFWLCLTENCQWSICNLFT